MGKGAWWYSDGNLAQRYVAVKFLSGKVVSALVFLAE